MSLQWMLQTPGATSYMGCIGKDKYGEEMKKNAQAAGVTVSSFILHFFYHSKCSALFVNSLMWPWSCYVSSRLITTRMRLLLQAHVLSVLLVAKGLQPLIIPLTSYCFSCYSVASEFCEGNQLVLRFIFVMFSWLRLCLIKTTSVCCDPE
jgi:hypothetical protein